MAQHHLCIALQALIANHELELDHYDRLQHALRIVRQAGLLSKIGDVSDDLATGLWAERLQGEAIVAFDDNDETRWHR